MTGYIGIRARRKRRNTYFFFFIILIFVLFFLFFNSIDNNYESEYFDNNKDINLKVDDTKDNQLNLQKEKIRNLENKVSFLSLDNNSLKKELEGLKIQIEKNDSDNIQNKSIDQNKINTLMDKISKLDNLIKKLDKEKIDLLNSISKSENDYNLLEVRLKEMSKETLNLKTQNNLFKEDLAELKKNNISQQKIIEKFEDASHH